MRYLLFIICIWHLGCYSPKEDINISEYLLPNFKQDSIMLYEFENSNLELLPIKYMGIERFEDNFYRYSYMNSNFDIISGYVEYRGANSLKVNSYLLSELTSEGKLVISEYAIRGWKIPYQMQLDKNYSYSTKFESNIKEGISYSITTTRKAVEKIDKCKINTFEGKSITYSIEEIFIINDKIEDLSQNTKNKSTCTYMENTGLVKMETKFPGGVTIRLSLEKIYRGDNAAEILNKDKSEINI